MAAANTPELFKTPQSQKVYAALLAAMKPLGKFDVEVKKTSVHIARGRAFAGVHPRAGGIIVQIVTDAPIKSPRVKVEQLSARRFHCAVKLEDPKDVNTQLMGWLKQAYALAEAV